MEDGGRSSQDSDVRCTGQIHQTRSTEAFLLSRRRDRRRGGRGTAVADSAPGRHSHSWFRSGGCGHHGRGIHGSAASGDTSAASFLNGRSQVVGIPRRRCPENPVTRPDGMDWAIGSGTRGSTVRAAAWLAISLAGRGVSKRGSRRSRSSAGMIPPAPMPLQSRRTSA